MPAVMVVMPTKIIGMAVTKAYFVEDRHFSSQKGAIVAVRERVDTERT
jgi:hypothetical protein